MARNKPIPPNFGSKTATTFCHVYCGRLGQRTQSTPWPLTLINPGLECCIQGVAICVPCCVKASLLPHSLSSLPVFRSSQVIRRGLLKPRDDRMAHYFHLKLDRNVCLETVMKCSQAHLRQNVEFYVIFHAAYTLMHQL